MTSDAAESDIARVVETIEKMGWSAHPLPGESRTAVAVTGNRGSIDPALFENLPGVAEAIRVTKPYKLSSNARSTERTTVTIGDTAIGDGSLTIIAGPCAVESEEQVFAAAQTVAASGVKLFRGGAYKPRTSPYAFQGLGEDGLKLLAGVRKEFGLSIVTEAMDERGIDLVREYGDCIQIGARNMQNFALLRAAGRARIPILLKRGLSATLDEFLLSAEYIMAEGNENVILCERGIRTFADHARNTLDISIVPALRRKSHLPVIVDPSHAAGHNYMVAPLARAAVAVGSDGLLIEMHPCPEDALCDGAQALTPGQYLSLLDELKALHQALDRESIAVA
ncbi:MAG TPA: 3-deoxy-7-phosphoheptulonate synthase [Pyrinomonadaceae bacterium]|nr:3-deoxy-7-phosphoheptulonate synthase [Pyrinomonadaceae bacterium]